MPKSRSRYSKNKKKGQKKSKKKKPSLIDDEDEEQAFGKHCQTFCLTWVKQNAAKLVPDKVQLSKEEIQELIELDKQRNEADSKKVNKDDDEAKNSNEDEDDDLKEFEMDDYDDEPEEGEPEGLSGMVMFSSNDDDPYMTGAAIESDEEEVEEEEAINLLENDNLLVCARCNKDYSLLAVYVYNHVSKDFYVHHDIPLNSTPLCMEWLDFDPGCTLDSEDSDKGNFVAIGNMDSVIDVWDLDVLNTTEPAFSLGVTKNKQKKLVLMGKEDFGHTDVILDLSWNCLLRKKLASASADHLVALWDLENGIVERKFSNHRDKVQTIEWKPESQDCLLSGGFDGSVIALDTRSGGTSSGHLKWSLEGEIERVAWNRADTNYFAASTDGGNIYYCDVRNTSTSLLSFKAHDQAIPALSVTSPYIYSGSSDGMVKKWRMGEEEAKLEEESDKGMGMVHCFQPNPDVESLFAVGGQKGAVSLWKVDSSQTINPTSEDELEDTDVPMQEENNVDATTNAEEEEKKEENQVETSGLAMEEDKQDKGASDEIPEKIVKKKKSKRKAKDADKKSTERADDVTSMTSSAGESGVKRKRSHKKKLAKLASS